MFCSLSEIDTLTQKAALGAGMFWGLAEETGKAVRWLEAHDLPGLALLADLLEQNDGKPYSDLAPFESAGVWLPTDATNRALCPLIAGVTLCDHSARLGAGRHCRFGATSYPLLIAPFAAQAASACNRPLLLCWSGVEMVFSDGKLQVSADSAELTAANALCLSVTLAETAPAMLRLKPVRTTHAPVADSLWRRLDGFARRTYVPASDVSRHKGAGDGATLNDND